MDSFQGFIIAAPVLLFSMVAHEYAHGYAALRQGDPTAYQLGRLTWNPLKHIDPFMTVLMPIVTFYSWGFIFGGAKPVPVFPSNFRNLRRGDIIVSLAGIASNLVLFVVCTILIVLLGVLGRAVPPAQNTIGILQLMMVQGITFNLVLAVFNLLPIPPLDGSRVMKYLLPPAWALRYEQFGRYGIIVLLVMFLTPVGKQIFMTWMTPVTVVGSAALRAVRSFMLTSPYGIGVG